MPFLDLPCRSGLRMYYAVNPTVDPVTDAIVNDLSPVDHSKPSVVLLHSALSSVAAFSAQFSDARLAGAFNLIGLDSRLHGLTTGLPKESHTIENSADCLIAALDSLELTSYAIVGESIKGSNEACWIALKRPEKVRALCLVSPSWHISPKEVSDSMISDFLPLLLSRKDGNGDGTIPEPAVKVMEDFFFGSISRGADRRSKFRDNFNKRYGEGYSSHDLNHLVRWFGRERIPADRLATITAPVLVLHGTADTQVAPLSSAEEWRDSFPSARGGADLRTISGGPHLALYTDFRICNRFLLAFVKRNYGDF